MAMTWAAATVNDRLEAAKQQELASNAQQEASEVLRRVVLEQAPRFLDDLASELIAAAIEVNRLYHARVIHFSRDSGAISLIVPATRESLMVRPDFIDAADPRPGLRILDDHARRQTTSHHAFAIDAGRLVLNVGSLSLDAAAAARTIAEPWFRGIQMPDLLAPGGHS